MFKEDEPGPLVLLVGRKIPLREGFSDYMVDYLAYLWPFGQLAITPPIYVSNMMIKRVVSTGFTNETEEQFAFSALRALPMANNQLSTAFMPRDLSLKFIEEFNQAKAVG
jgi:hypothetical protein